MPVACRKVSGLWSGMFTMMGVVKADEGGGEAQAVKYPVGHLLHCGSFMSILLRV